jgi:hypothetical protein
MLYYILKLLIKLLYLKFYPLMAIEVTYILVKQLVTLLYTTIIT